MNIHRGYKSVGEIRNAVVTSGTFDGVHFGHAKIIQRLVESAKSISGESVVLTFWPHPRFVLQPDAQHSLRLLTTLEEKADILRQLGVDHLVVIPFNQDFASLSSLEFIQEVLVDSLKTKKLIIGYDHRFGRNREGSFEYLQANASTLGFEIEEIPRQDLQNVGVSSIKVRDALENGNTERAVKYLGRSYAIEGVVVKGNQLGREIGYPTANMGKIYPYKLIPKQGIYAVEVQLGDAHYKGMMNIGNRPTVAQGGHQTIEVNIFDFERDIYGQAIKVSLVKYLRDEMKFDSLDKLKAQLEQDKADTLAYFGS